MRSAVSASSSSPQRWRIVDLNGVDLDSAEWKCCRPIGSDGKVRKDRASTNTALSVRLMMAVAWAHPFEQGNKRTGFIAAYIFLDANGWLLDIPDFEEIAEQIKAAIDDPSLEDELADLFGAARDVHGHDLTERRVDGECHSVAVKSNAQHLEPPRFTFDRRRRNHQDQV